MNENTDRIIGENRWKTKSFISETDHSEKIDNNPWQYHWITNKHRCHSKNRWNGMKAWQKSWINILLLNSLMKIDEKWMFSSIKCDFTRKSMITDEKIAESLMNIDDTLVSMKMRWITLRSCMIIDYFERKCVFIDENFVSSKITRFLRWKGYFWTRWVVNFEYSWTRRSTLFLLLPLLFDWSMLFSPFSSLLSLVKIFHSIRSNRWPW